jgi:nitroimidazol reductase NimA-like FMN-containing flavoprotein (pyridoxamine 5'-phosphate oxidase superfamily)
MRKNKAEIKNEIIKFLDENSTKKSDKPLPGCGLKHGIACALGTCKNNIPRVTPIDFFNDGLTLWMIGNAGGKLGNIRSNPKVAVGIYTRMDHAKENRSIQLWGKASLITKRGQKELFMKIITKFGILDAIKKSLEVGMIDFNRNKDFETQLDKSLHNITMIKVEPERIALFIIPPDGKSEKLIWEKR